MDPYLCAFIISGYQLFMAIISTIVSSIIPRRRLFLVCCALEVIGNLILATMVYFNRQEYFSDVRREYPFVNLIALVGIPFYYGGYYTGYVPVILALLSERMPSNARNIGSSLATTLSLSSLFILIKLGPTLQEKMGLDGCFWLFSGITFCSIIFCYFFVSETFGRSLESIEDHYRAICYRNKIEPEMPLEITPNDLEPKATCDT